MTMLQIQLDEALYTRSLEIAAQKNTTLEELVREFLAHLSTTVKDPLWGMFTHEPELLDDIVAAALKTRATQPWRTPHA